MAARPGSRPAKAESAGTKNPATRKARVAATARGPFQRASTAITTLAAEQRDGEWREQPKEDQFQPIDVATQSLGDVARAQIAQRRWSDRFEPREYEAPQPADQAEGRLVA